jgi:hypothetical protein
VAAELVLGALTLAVVAPAVAQNSAAAPLRGADLVAALRAGGYILYFRHADTDHSQNDQRMTSVEDVARGKPAPDLFLHAARSLGVARSRCAIVEDSSLGVDAANAAGMVAFGFARLTLAGLLSHALGGIFSSMTELPALLER